jgi:aryl-alcohol dehydrogenase-like predicted oxidoreductase
MRQCTRRHFLKSTLSGAGVLLTAPALSERLCAGPASAGFHGSDLVPLGKTGIKVSRLAQGTGFDGYRRSSEHTRQGKDKFDRLMRHSLDAGVRFIDMADLYGSHPFVKDVVKGLPREKLVLLTKIWPRKEDWVTPSGGAKEEIDRFRQELGVEMVDVCLIHCMLNDKWPTEFERIRDGLSELKQQGAVRAVGVSCHDFGALKVAAEHPWVDVIFARINHKGGEDYACDAGVQEVSEVLKKARKNGKAIVGMKIFGAGKLVKPEEKDASLAYVFRNDLVDAITIGMLKVEEVDDTLKRMRQVNAV